MTSSVNTFDEPDELAGRLVAAPRPLLLGLDIDGVLAPIVERADDAALTPGVMEAVAEVSALTPVVVVSGRDLASIERLFGFTPDIPVIGSHGIEQRGRPLELDADERDRLTTITELAERAAAQAGDGAWVERKPNGAALHVREAAQGRGLEALTWLEHSIERVDGASGKAGHEVYEAMARPTTKATAMAEQRSLADAATVAFVGDDLTDEDVFRSLGPNDYSIRVGNGTSTARHRLAAPSAVLDLLSALCKRWS